MCRFATYLGPELTLDLLTTRPKHSLIHQSYESEERKEPLNGDGFGVCWYVRELAEEPGRFRSVRPAWSNQNLRKIARVTRSGCMLAHIRAASPGLAVTETNCHPFVYGRFALMHNGYLAGFKRVQRRLLATLSNEAFHSILGTTDSEHLLALFLDRHRELAALTHAGERVARALDRTIASAMELTSVLDLAEPSQLNLAVSDGERIAVARFSGGDPEDANSLYVHTGKRYVCQDGQCRMVEPDGGGSATLVASEKLSGDPGWDRVPGNHILLVRRDRSVEMRPVGRW